MAISFNGGRSQNTRKEPPTMGKRLVILITCGCESSAHVFWNLQSRARTLVASHWQTLSHNVVHLALIEIRTRKWTKNIDNRKSVLSYLVYIRNVIFTVPGCQMYTYIHTYIGIGMAISFNGGRSQNTRKEPPTMGKRLVSLITCGCESSAHVFRNLQSRRRLLLEWIL
jgi:hypothetical protein